MVGLWRPEMRLEVVRLVRNRHELSIWMRVRKDARKPVVEGDTITYPGVRPHVDLVYTVATDGIKGSLILSRPIGKARFRFGITSPTLSVIQDRDGQLRFVDSTGRTVWRLAPLFMVDAAGAVSTAVSATWDAKNQVLVIEADEKWIRDKARVFPIRIDPSLELEPGLLGVQPYWSYWTYELDDLGEFQVNLATGNLVHTYTDVEFSGQGLTTVFARVYNSQAEFNGSLGYNWIHNGHMFLLQNPDGSVTYTDETGYRTVFRPDGAGGFISPPGVHKKLTVLGNPDGEYFRLEHYRTHVTEYFDRYGKLLRRVDNNGNETRYSYTNNVLSSITDASGQTFTLEHDTAGDGGIVRITDPAGRATTYQRDSYGNLIAVERPDGAVLRLEYDAPRHLLTRITDARGRTVSIRYDAEGRVQAVTDAEGLTTTFSYDSATHTTTVTDPKGKVTTYRFNDRGNLVELTEPSGDTWRYEWDDQHNKIAQVDPKGNRWTYTYDAKGNLLTETDPYGKVTRHQYDANNNLIKTTDAEGASVSFTYDSRNNLTGSTDSAGSSEKLAYDAKGNPTTYTDGNGNVWRYAYDANGNLTGVTDPLGGQASYTYSAANQITSSQIEAGGKVYSKTTYGYDRLDRLVSITDANGRTITQSYDANGNLVEVAYPNGHRVSHTYDSLNRRTATQHDGATVYTFEYDANNNLTAMSQPGEANPFRFTYDANNRLTRETTPWGTATTYSYDAASNMIGLGFEVGGTSHAVRSEYDSAGRLTSLTEPNGHTVTFSYGANDRLASVSYPAGIREQLSYDAANKVTAVEHVKETGEVLLRQAYTYDGDGNKLEVVDEQGRKTVYTYDGLNRLTSETDPVTGEKTVYAYDPAGNRLKKTVYRADGTVASETTYTYDQANQLTSVNGTPFTYDEAGNLTSDGRRQFLWDAAGRLAEVRDAATGKVLASFVYDGKGRRIAKITSAGTIRYHYAGSRVAYETDETGAIVRMYSYDAAGVPVTMWYEGKTYYFLTNDRGDVLQIVDGQGNVVASYRYDAWGNILEESGPLADVNPYRYAGYRWDGEVGLYFLRTRYYDPSLGRFVSRDSILGAPANTQTLNTYQYALNNPVRYTDPDGRTAVAAAVIAFPSLGPLLTAAAVGVAAYSGYVLLSKKKGASKKSIQRGIQSLKDRIAEHGRKLRQEPAPPWVKRYWKDEIKEYARQIAEKMGRLRRR